MPTLNPTFVFLMEKYTGLRCAGLERTEEARLLFSEAMQYAPDEFLKMAHEEAVAMGLMPETPDAYSDDGEPLYNLEAMAERLGIDMADVPDDLISASYTGTVHRVQ